ncbi:unnamed protein product [Adineta ricciae]|uniref:LIM zinc-binding domain-containing protein n=1 Tax=Adineta ricciae TaxID=249248 RepID=A0A814XJ98_ADIRI|nr:unnamed protein product [Adineta ricciae]
MSAKSTKTVLIKCKTCTKEIVSDEEYLLDGEDVVHVQCYLCSHCQTSLAGRFYYRNKDSRSDGKPNLVCESCYYRLAPVCFQCLKIIEDISLRYGERIFHPNCFLCQHCQKPFQGQLVYPYQNQVFCSKCYPHVQNEFLPASNTILISRCSICRKQFQAGDLITEHRIELPMDKIEEKSINTILYIHNSCFVCEICHRNLSNSVYYLPNSVDEDCQQMKFQCEKCHQTSATLCSMCFKPSDELMVIFNRRWYHEQCFKCKNCQYNLKRLPRIVVEPDGLMCERCFKVIHEQQEQL